jgi:hypothetical protein
VSGSLSGEGGEDPSALLQENPGDVGVTGGKVLNAFTEGVLGTDEEPLKRSRGDLLETLGSRELVDAAAVVAAFSTVNRVADATGIPLDGMLDMASAPLRERLGLHRFASAENTPAPNILKRTLSRCIQPMVPGAIRLMASFQRRPGTGKTEE